MMTCNFCKKTISTNTIGSHLLHKHNISTKEYLYKFGYIKKCKICGDEGSRLSLFDYMDICNQCIKKQTIDTINSELGLKLTYNINTGKYVNFIALYKKRFPEKFNEQCNCGGGLVRYLGIFSTKKCKKCYNQNDYSLDWKAEYENFRGKCFDSDPFGIKFWEKELDNKEIILKLIKYFKKNRYFFKKEFINCNNKKWLVNLSNEIISSNFTLDIDKKFKTSNQFRKENIKKNFTSVSYDFWIDRGYSLEQAKKLKIERDEKIKNSGVQFEKMIKKYGYENGNQKWYNFLEKSKQTVENFISRYGKEMGLKKYESYINKLSATSTKKYRIDKFGVEWYISYIEKLKDKNKKSKISQNLFWKIKNRMKDCSGLFFGEYNKEWYVYDNIFNRWYFVDFKYKNKIIEFYGDYWHKNPKKFKETEDTVLKWKYDSIRENVIRKNFDLLVIWESEYIKDPGLILNKCLSFLEENKI